MRKVANLVSIFSSQQKKFHVEFVLLLLLLLITMMMEGAVYDVMQTGLVT